MVTHARPRQIAIERGFFDVSGIYTPIALPAADKESRTILTDFFIVATKKAPRKSGRLLKVFVANSLEL